LDRARGWPNTGLMHLIDSTLSLALIALFAAPVLSACTDDGGAEESADSETETGGGESGDGETGETGETGDGETGDAETGDGETGETGDGETGETGDGETGETGDGETSDTGDVCEAMDAELGPEDCFDPQGWFWDGESCEQIICTCVGSDCGDLFETEALCVEVFADCGALECVADDAVGEGPCEAFFGYAWDGGACVGISGCECVGDDCEDLAQEPETCESDHAGC